MPKKIDPNDIVGNRYGMLTVIDYAGKKGNNHYYTCRCDCGNESVVRRSHLMLNETRSCGCTSAFRADTSDIIGKRYGKLVVKKYIGYVDTPCGKLQSAYLCQCDCGNEVTILRHDLKANYRVSCGRCFPSYIEWEGEHFRYVCSNGSSWIFDSVDYPLVSSKQWHIDSGGYPSTWEGNERLLFHRMVMNAKNTEIIDHINGDKTDNRRGNLRFATPMSNQHNKCLSPLSQTGYKGITKIQRKNRVLYRASIRVNYKRIYLGEFIDPEEAARAYDEAARFYFGEFACVNFPLPGEQGCRRNEEKEEAYA